MQLKVSVFDNQQVLEHLLEERIDFGFLTAKTTQTSVTYMPYCKERYVLFGPAKSKRTVNDADDLRECPMVHYPGAETALEAWAAGNFPKARVSFRRLSVVGHINELAGVLAFLREGVGYAVMAEHCARTLLAEGVDVAQGVFGARMQVELVNDGPVTIVM